MTNGNFTRPGNPAEVTNSQAGKPTYEQLAGRHQEISGLLAPLVGAGSEPGTACARLCYLAEDLFTAAALDSSGQPRVYDVQAMLAGAQATADASPGQVAIIEKVLPLLDEYVDWLDGVAPASVSKGAGRADTLEPREYLEFLRMLEDGLPNGTRAYLVSLDTQGTRRLTAVGTESSVVDLRQDLISHLNDATWFGEAQAHELLEYCEDRLNRMGAKLPGAVPALTGQRREVALSATYQIEAMVDSLLRAAHGDELDNLPYLLRGVGMRVHEVNSIIMSALDDDMETEDELLYRLEGRRTECELTT